MHGHDDDNDDDAHIPRRLLLLLAGHSHVRVSAFTTPALRAFLGWCGVWWMEDEILLMGFSFSVRTHPQPKPRYLYHDSMYSSSPPLNNLPNRLRTIRKSYLRARHHSSDESPVIESIVVDILLGVVDKHVSLLVGEFLAHACQNILQFRYFDLA